MWNGPAARSTPSAQRAWGLSKGPHAAKAPSARGCKRGPEGTAASAAARARSARGESQRGPTRAKSRLEAPPGFEPGMELLQSSALPLGDGAGRNSIVRGIRRVFYARLQQRKAGNISVIFLPPGRAKSKTPAAASEGRREPPQSGGPSAQRAWGMSKGAPRARSLNWSGKRDSNPRLRPWQGRTLPLSYSRSPNPRRPQTSSCRHFTEVLIVPQPPPGRQATTRPMPRTRARTP